MKTFTKVLLFMLAMVLSTSFMFAQNMTQEELKDYQQLIMQKNAALGPVTYNTNSTRAAGDDCTDPLSYGNINDAPVTGYQASSDEIWYSFTGADDMTVAVSLCNSDYDTKLEVWWQCSDGSYAFYNDDACGTRSEITGIPFTGGSTNYVKVYGYGTASGNYELEITGVLPPPGPDPITAFPFEEDFESGSFPSTMVANIGSAADLFISSDAAYESTYGALFEGYTSTGWTNISTVSGAFGNTSHVASLDLEVQPDGSVGLLTMEFDLLQHYTYNQPNYEWFRVLVDGVAIPDTEGNYWQQASTGMDDNFAPHTYDLSAYQGLGSFDLQIQNAGKYWSGYTSSYDGDQAYVDNFEIYYLTIGSVEGHVYSPDGLPMPNATVGIEEYGVSTMTDATGYYLIEDVPGGETDITAWKEGYNAVSVPINILASVTIEQDITLTQPSITINPLFFDEILNPNEYLTKYLGLLNTGSGPGDWTATINYLSSSSTGVTNVTGQPYPQTTASSEPAALAREGGEPFTPQHSRDLFECNEGSLFGNSPVGADNAYWSQYGGTYQQYQQINGVSGSWTTITFWGVYLSGTPTTEDFFIGVYEDNGSTYGSEIASYVLPLDPIATGEVLLGSYPIYQYIATIPSQDASDFWVSCQATSQMYWVNSLTGTGNTTADDPLAVCIEGGGGGLTGWLTLGTYDGTVPGNGASQNVEVNFDATGGQPGEVYTAEIVLETDPNVGIFNIPVTMTIFGDPLNPVTDLTVSLESMISGQVNLAWQYSSDVTFQYFLIKRNGLAVGTTTELSYIDMLPDFGSYCYTVTPVFDEGNGVPAGPECVDWLIPELCWSPATVYNEQWPDSQEEVILTLENCGEGMLSFAFPDYLSGSRFACTMQVVLYDSYGDGWNGGSLDVLVNGVVVLNDITIASGSGPEYYSFPAESGDDISTVYTAGSWSSENSYEILDGDGNVIYSAGNVSIPEGVVYGTCPQPSFIVDVEPATGTVAEGSTLDVVLTYDATGFPAGLYDEYLNIETNDPVTPEEDILNQMLVYIPGQFYGTVTDCNSGLGIESVTVTAGDYTATTDGTGYYELYVDEGTYDVNFTLLGFETATVLDTMAVEGAMTEVSVTMCEEPYPVRWVYADPNEADTECDVTWTLPMGPYEIIYDDGEANDFVVWTQAGGAVGVSFTPAGYPATVTGGRLFVGDGSFPAGANFLGSPMAVGVIDDDGVDGMPGTILDSVVVTVDNYGWVSFDGVFENAVFTDGDFYIVMWQIGWATNSAPVGVDTDLPTTYRSVAKLPGMGDWAMSPYQDFMIRAIVDGPNQGVVGSNVGQNVVIPKVVEGPFLATSLPAGISGTVKSGEFRPMEATNASRDMTNYQIARVSDFDPDLGPETGTHTIIGNPTTESYTDAAFGGQPEGFYAYGVKAIYESNESIWVYSNTVAHGLDNEVTIEVTCCDGTSPEDADVVLMGQNYPYDVLFGTTDTDGIVVFDSVINGVYDLYVDKVGYATYEHMNLGIFEDLVYPVMLIEKMYKPRNLVVDPLSSHATWDEPFITSLFLETFEGTTFPPEGWQSYTQGVGWVRTDDGSSSAWTIPAGDGYYACANDDGAGSDNDGSMDYLITPELDLRESDAFNLYFSSYYDGTYSQSAYVEYSLDAGATWEVLEAMSPGSAWEEIEVDLSAFSGLDSNPIWLAFHADDNGEWASGWAVDNVLVQNGPAEVVGYWVYLDGAFVAQTDAETREYTFMDLQYGQEYTAEVRALYACALSDPIYYTWNSTYLHPPRNLMDEYVYGTNEVPLFWNPPITGVIPMISEVKTGQPNNQEIDKNADIRVVPQSRNLWDLQFAVDLTTITGAAGNAGAESDGEFVYATRWASSEIEKYTIDGTFIEEFSIPGVSGLRDLAYDGQYFYGGAASTTVYKMDFESQTLVSSFTAPTAVRAIAYDSDLGGFWGNNWDSDMILFDESGATLGTISGVPSCYGAAYDNFTDDGPFLWLFTGTASGGGCQIEQMEVATGALTGFVHSVSGDLGATIAGGLYIAENLVSGTYTLGGTAQGDGANDTGFGYEIGEGGVGPTPGGIPDGLISFNVYRDAENVANVPYEDQQAEDWVTYVENYLMPGEYAYDVSAVYELTDYGFPGETAESAWEGTVIVNVVWGNEIPFFEGWDQGTFEFQGWSFNENGDNWVINSQYGDPEPSAEFTWDPLLEDGYTSALESNPINADYLTEGDIFLDFDIALENRTATGEEKILVEVYNGSDWNQVAEFANTESFDFTSNHINITNYAMSRVFQVRFNATGNNSFDVISWFVDNISIYRVCQAPIDLTGEYVWLATEDFGAEVCWGVDVPVPVADWFYYDDETVEYVWGSDTGDWDADVAIKVPSSDLAEFDGAAVTTFMAFVDSRLLGVGTVSVKVMQGDNPDPSSPMYEEDVTSQFVTGDDWNTFELSTPVEIDNSEDLWLGLYFTGPAGAYGPGITTDMGVSNSDGELLYDAGSWTTLATMGINNRAWLLRGYVTTSYSMNSNAVVNVVPENSNLQTAGSVATATASPNLDPNIVMNNSREITGFNIYRMAEGATEYELYDFVDVVSGQTEYCYYDGDVDVQMGYYYQVTATYESDTDACESPAAMAYDNPTEDFVYVFITSVEDADAATTSIFPNPAQDHVTVTSSQPMTKITVTNYMGQVVYTSEVNANSVELNTGSYQTGVYVVKIDTEDGVVTKRVIITK